MWRFSPLGALALSAGILAALPILGVIAVAFTGPGTEIPARDVARYAATSAWLALLVGIGTAIIGTGAAWLTVMYRFPGVRFFGWALALPLAAPGFALAYAYADLFDVAGPMRIALRVATGADLPFELRSVGGSAFVLTCAFYPYVFLAMRAAFLNQSAAPIDAARMLGCTPRQAFIRAALPLARPALAAGVALAVMETLADYGAVRFLSVQTLTTGVVRAWSVFGSPGAAARFALPLLAAAALLLWIERRGRRGTSAGSGRSEWRTVPATRLTGGAALIATASCIALLGVALVLPAGWLAWTALGFTPEIARLAEAAANSFGIAVAGALVTTLFATMLALGAKRQPLATRFASLGYATPGAVMAIGLLVPAAIIWRAFPGNGFAVGIMLLLYAYAARLIAAALEPIEAGLTRVSPNIPAAARTLGRGEFGAELSIRLPIASGALFTAALIVFIDVLKELPATLILRPFDFDTLAVIANSYALDERLGQAGWPALLVIILALPPVAWLSRKIAGSRPGAY